MNETIDVEEDVSGNRVDKLMFSALVFTRMYFVLSFILFGVASDITNNLFLIFTVVFLVFMILSVLNETRVVRLLQQIDPMKKGDPTSFKFHKDYFKSLDEAEKNKTYQTTYHTFRFMEVALVALMVVSFILKDLFDVGNGPILMVGLTWILQSVSFFYYSKKFDKV